MGINYFRNGEVIKITILDSSRRKLEEHMCNTNDSTRAGKIMKYLDDKYGFKPTIDLNNSPSFDKLGEDDQNHDKDDIDWWA